VCVCVCVTLCVCDVCVRIAILRVEDHNRRPMGRTGDSWKPMYDMGIHLKTKK
jgi:hypothetical protein